MNKATKARWLGEKPKWAWESLAISLLLCVGLAVVHFTGAPHVDMWLVCLWVGHFVTACVWWRRLLKAQREAREAQD